MCRCKGEKERDGQRERETAKQMWTPERERERACASERERKRGGGEGRARTCMPFMAEIALWAETGLSYDTKPKPLLCCVILSLNTVADRMVPKGAKHCRIHPHTETPTHTKREKARARASERDLSAAVPPDGFADLRISEGEFGSEGDFGGPGDAPG